MDAFIKAQIVGSIPEKFSIGILTKPTSYDMWERILSLAEEKSDLFIADIRAQITTQKPESREKLPLYLDEIMKLREQLRSMGSTMSDTEINSAIIIHLPSSYRASVSALTTSYKALRMALTTDTLIEHINDEWEHDRITGDIKVKPDQDENSALAARNHRGGRGNSSRGRGGPRGRGGRGGSRNEQQQQNQEQSENKYKGYECYNCGKCNHIARDCQKQGGAHQANALVNTSSSLNGFKPNNSQQPQQKNKVFIAEYALLSSPPPLSPPQIIDMGASSHFSLDKLNFANLVTIPLECIQVANRQVFYANMKGDYSTVLPNGSSTTQVTLRDVLYVPQMPYMLISVSWLDRVGYSLQVKQGLCEIANPSGKMIARIPEQQGLYRVSLDNGTQVTAKAAEALAAMQTVLIMRLHAMLGHIHPDTARRLVDEGIISGISLDLTSKVKFCNTCISAKIY